ncbi:MAG: GTPase domain-containing protein [Candidatus Lokiarchaeia archaeon]
MISKILIIMSNGVLCYSRTFVGDTDIDNDLVSGFLTAISSIAREIGGGEIRSLNFRNFNFIYTRDDENLCMFIIVTDIDDPEEVVRDKLELLKTEFINRFHTQLKNWDCETRKFEVFDEFVEERIFIPPKILICGEEGVGKTTMMSLFPGETILELDDDLNEIIQKPITLSSLKRINECILREIDLKELIDNSKIYRSFLDSVDIIILVTNSGASNLGRTQRLFSKLEKKVKKADFYLIANFQDLQNTSYEPEKVQKMFGIQTYGFCAIKREAKEKILDIISEMVRISIVQKIVSKQT